MPAVPTNPGRRPLVVVVGAGIAGLAAAWELVSSPDRPCVVVLEAAGQVGGKLATGEVGGVSVDLGAEALLARRPEALDLARQVGLAEDLVSPRRVAAAIWSGGSLHPLPAGTLMGVPSSVAGLGGLLAGPDLQAVAAESARTWAPLDDDVSVADLVSARVGPGVLARLVEPLLGGVYAGRATNLSVRATVPALWAAAAGGTSIVAAAAHAAARGASTRAPVFAGVRGGVGRLPLEVARAIRERGGEVRTATTVRGLERRGAGWRLVTGPTSAPAVLDADAVLLATPGAPAARLLRDVAPAAAAALAQVEYASVALVTFVFERRLVEGLTGSGVLVPPVEGRYMKAATFASSKWQWLDDRGADRVVVRASVGRYGGVQDLQRPDQEVARRVLADLRELPGVRLPEPLDARVDRWGGGLPQYSVGHLDRVQQALADVARRPGLALAGAVYEGVGVAACVASGRRAARQVMGRLVPPAG